jgi:energy-coupling factor transport system substrate-specific component
MGWRLGSFVILALVLAGGLAWYERSRPSSRIVALVAALAALAVAGRLVFAPIPNVQATTDVVFFTGFALGAAPGFAVGALGALISNIWLGQGPWTPWEMAGWGLVGLGGAALGVLTTRRLGRVGLAVACGLAGLAYGALLDFSVMATSGGEQSLDRYLALAARGVPFNVAHAVGNVLLALAAGPALVRMISRYRERLEFEWRSELAAPLAVLALMLVPFAAPGATAGAAGSAAGWLQSARNDDGGFGTAPGSDSSTAMTGWAMLGLESAGRNPLDLGAPGSTPVDYLRSHAGGLSSTGDLERTILALLGAGVSPRHFGGHDLLAELRSQRSKDGSFQGQVNLTAFAILALRGAGEPSSGLSGSASWLGHAQGSDGGWGFQPGSSSDPDSTGAALQALAAAGGAGGRISSGVGYLRDDQQPDGGWPLGGNGPSNSQSTAWAIQGLVAAGGSPASVTSHGRSGLDYLAARRAADGHYRYSASSDQTPVWVTGQALAAVEGKAFPLAAVARAPRSHHHTGGSGSRDSGGTPAGSGGSDGPGSAPPNGATPGGTYGPSGGSGSANHARYRPKSDKKGGKAPAKASGPAEGRRLFANAVGSVPRGSTTAPATSGGDSHTSRYVGAAILVAALAGLGYLWWRRRAA